MRRESGSTISSRVLEASALILAGWLVAVSPTAEAPPASDPAKKITQYVHDAAGEVS